MFKQGYDPVLIKPGQKAPVLQAWTEYTRHMTKADLTLSEKHRGLFLGDSTINDWIAAHPNANLGVMTGSGRGALVGVDIDEPSIADLVMSIIPASPVMKYGSKGYTPLFQNDGTVGRGASSAPMEPG